jgi:6-phosphogluconolactonase
MLQLTGTTLTYPDNNGLFQDLGDHVLASAIAAVQSRGAFHLALSGGSTPKPFYVSLATDAKFSEFPWPQTHVWIVDERRVPNDSSSSNFRMISESLAHLPGTNRPQLHEIQAMISDPAGEYESDLRQEFQLNGDKPPQLDFVLLGMGDDCHTASLFPNTDALQESKRWIVVNDGPNVTPPDRVTMTYPLLNAARQIAILCLGAKKQEALKRVVMLDEPDLLNVPISGIRPTNGNVTWYLDEAAAGDD